MRVVATAGHVDHGKSTLVRALTGTDPDRWDEEHRRGLTIDLGYAWTRLPGLDEDLAFVDVPGHQRFIANMLAGIGPAPAVLFVVAADEGWRQQSTEHLQAVLALGIRHGVVAITRSDLADPADAAAQVRERLAGTGLAESPIIPVSAVTGEGLDELRRALVALCGELPPPTTDGRVRLWIDRAFTIRGAGTVVTGTLESGTLRVGDVVEIHRRSGPVRATVRGLQSLERPRDAVAAVARVAVNLRGIAVEDVARGDALLTPDAWHTTELAEVRLDRLGEGRAADPEKLGGYALKSPPSRPSPRDVQHETELPAFVMAHVGTAAVQVRVRPLSEHTARLTLPVALPLQAGDRLVLRDPGQQRVLAGAEILDVDPPELRMRGAARRRGAELEAADAALDPLAEVTRRGWMRVDELTALGATPAQLDALTDAVTRHGALLISAAQAESWAAALHSAVAAAVDADPLQARTPLAAAAQAAGLPDRGLVAALADAAGIAVADGHASIPGRTPSLGAAEAGLQEALRRLEAQPFLAPERDDLAAWGLGPRQLAAAVRMGRLVDLGDQIVLAPRAPALAMRELAQLPQPFTTSEARQALGTTRRVVIPLLEELDRRGWTRRIDAGHREVARPKESR